METGICVSYGCSAYACIYVIMRVCVSHMQTSGECLVHVLRAHMYACHIYVESGV